MKLLIVTYSFVPDLTPRAFRWGAVARQLADLGNEVHVLCATAANGDEPKGLHIHRVPDPLSRQRRHAYSSGQGAGSSGRSFKEIVKSGLRRLYQSLYWPDYAFAWIPAAASKAAELQQQQGFDWVVTSSHPFSGHVVWLLARKKDSAAGWLVDIGDPYSTMADPSPFNRAVYGALSASVERRIIRAADCLTTTTEETAVAQEVHFPEARGRISVIPPLLSLPTPAVSEYSSDGPRSLVFVGTLYRSLRNPSYLISLFHRLKAVNQRLKYELHFFGNVNDCGDLLQAAVAADRSIVAHGLVDRNTVAEAMASAFALVNIGNRSRDQLGSKVIEYMAMGKPILNMISHDGDLSERTLMGYPSKATFREPPQHSASDEQLAAEATRLAGFLKSPPIVPIDHIMAVRQTYSPERIAGQYLEILKKGAGRRPESVKSNLSGGPAQ